MRRRSKGFTVLEVLVAASILALLVGLLAMVISPALRITARESTRSDLLAQASLALDSLSQDLLRAPVEGLVFGELGIAEFFLSAHPAERFNSSGRLVYASHIRCYHWSEKELRLHQFEDVPRNRPFRPALEEVSDLLAAPVRRTFSTAVEQFNVIDQDPSTDPIELPLTCRIVLSREARSNTPPERVVFERSLFPRNG